MNMQFQSAHGDALAYLSTVEDALARVASLDAELDGVLATARKLDVGGYSTTTPGDDRVHLLVADVAERRAVAVRDAVELVGDCMERLDALGGDYARLLRLRHVDGKSWYEVADALSYSVRQCYRLHDAALVAFADYLPTHV